MTIDSGVKDVVTLDISPTIASLTIGGSTGSSVLQTSVTAETLDISGGLTINTTGTISLGSGSNLTVGGNATNSGGLFFAGNIFTVAGSLTNQGGNGFFLTSLIIPFTTAKLSICFR